MSASPALVPHLCTGDGAVRRELLPQPLIIYPIIQVLHVQVDPLQTGRKAAWPPPEGTAGSQDLQQLLKLTFCQQLSQEVGQPRNTPVRSVTWRGARAVRVLCPQGRCPEQSGAQDTAMKLLQELRKPLNSQTNILFLEKSRPVCSPANTTLRSALSSLLILLPWT